MRHLGLCLIFSAAIQSLCCADVIKLPAEDRKALEKSERFHEIHSTSDLSRPIVALCGGKLAEPGGNWKATDSIIDPTLPGKRLIWAATGGDYYVVHYERGGVAHTFHVLIAKLAEDEAKPMVVWSTVGGSIRDATTLSQRLSRYLESNTRELAVVRVPSWEEEQARHVSRQRPQLVCHRQKLEAQGRSLLISHPLPAPAHWWKEQT